MELSRSLVLKICGPIAGGLVTALYFLPGSSLASYIEANFGLSNTTIITWLIIGLGITLFAAFVLITAISIAMRLQPFHAEIVGKDRFLSGETIHFKAKFKGKLKNGFFTCKVPLPNGKVVWWPAFDTFQRTKDGDMGILSGRTVHKEEWGYQIPRDFPTGKYLVQIGVWDRRDSGSGNAPVKEKSVSFYVLPPGYKGTPGASAVISGDAGMFQIMESRPKLIITDADLKSDIIKKLVVRFPHRKVREHEVRFYYVKVRNEGEKTVDDVIAYCGANQIRFIPSTEKSTFGVDFEGPETLKEFDRFGIESYAVALIRDDRKVKDEIKYIHPGPVGESFVLFFTLKGYDDRAYVPAHTRVPHNIYGGTYGGRVIGHTKGIIRLHLSVEARDIEGCSAVFEIDFRNWQTFHVRQLDSTNES